MRRHRDGRAYIRVSEATADLIAGEVDLTEWDDEELLRATRRAHDGTFRGRPPTMVPIAVYQEFYRRQVQRAEQGFANNVARSVESLVQISEDTTVDARTRLKAIEMIHDRVFGKPKERVELSPGQVEPEHERIIRSVTVNRGALVSPDSEDVVDAEIVDDEDEYIDWDDEEDEV